MDFSKFLNTKKTDNNIRLNLYQGDDVFFDTCQPYFEFRDDKKILVFSGYWEYYLDDIYKWLSKKPQIMYLDVGREIYVYPHDVKCLLNKLNTKPPQFVYMDNSQKTTLRHIENKDGHCYYRDAGEWSVEYKIDDNNDIFSISEHKKIDNIRLIETTKWHYQKDNNNYIEKIF